MKRIEPTGNTVLLKITNKDIIWPTNEEYVVSEDGERASVKVGGLYIPDKTSTGIHGERDLHQDRLAVQIAEVIKISKELKEEPKANIGEKAIFERYEGIPISGNILGEKGTTYRIIENRKIFGRMREA